MPTWIVLTWGKRSSLVCTFLVLLITQTFIQNTFSTPHVSITQVHISRRFRLEKQLLSRLLSCPSTMVKVSSFGIQIPVWSQLCALPAHCTVSLFSFWIFRCRIYTCYLNCFWSHSYTHDICSCWDLCTLLVFIAENSVHSVKSRPFRRQLSPESVFACVHMRVRSGVCWFKRQSWLMKLMFVDAGIIG